MDNKYIDSIENWHKKATDIDYFSKFMFVCPKLMNILLKKEGMS